MYKDAPDTKRKFLIICSTKENCYAIANSIPTLLFGTADKYSWMYRCPPLTNADALY